MKRTMALLACTMAMAVPARAHHMIDGELPSGFLEGLLSGFGHPVIGPDHLLALVALGLLSAGPRVPLSFVLGSLAGVALPAAGLVPWATEAMVALSLVALGGLLLVGRRSDDAAVALLALMIGVVHGFAYAESIVGAEASPLGAYLVGLAIAQAVVVLAIRAFAERMRARATMPASWLHRLSGGTVVAAGLAMLVLGPIG